MRRAEAIEKRVRRLDLVGFLWRSECDDDDDDLAILNLIFIVMEGVVRDFRDLMGLFLLGMKRRDSVINECLFLRYYLKISRDVEKVSHGVGFCLLFWIVLVPLWGSVNVENGEWPIVRSNRRRLLYVLCLQRK